jgi:hypothetical protein
VVASNELVLHGWDLAVATGQDFEVAPENLEASWEMVSNTPDDPGARQGLFGPVVPVPEDAPLLDRVLGQAGRNPRWSPDGVRLEQALLSEATLALPVCAERSDEIDLPEVGPERLAEIELAVR